MAAIWQAGAWLPVCLRFAQTPTGYSHDLFAWLPLALGLLALVAIAAPVSLRSILEAVPIFTRRRKRP